MKPLYQLTDEALLVQAMLENDDVDQESFTSAMDALNIEIEAKIANIGLLDKSLSSDIEALDVEIKRLQARKKAAENKKAWLRFYALTNMQKTGKDKVKTPLVTVSVMEGRDRVVVDEDLLMAPYWRVKREPDKTMIKAELEQGNNIPGAHLERGDPTVTIR